MILIDNHKQRSYKSSYLKTSAIREPQENFDTSGFNVDYSDDDDDDDIIQRANNNNNASYQRATSPISLNNKTKPISLTSTINNQSQTNKNYNSDDGDDEDNGDHFGNDSGISSKNSSKPAIDVYSAGSDRSVDENGFILSKADFEKRQRSMRYIHI